MDVMQIEAPPAAAPLPRLPLHPAPLAQARSDDLSAASPPARSLPYRHAFANQRTGRRSHWPSAARPNTWSTPVSRRPAGCLLSLVM